MGTFLHPGQRVADRYEVRAAVEEAAACTTYAAFDREAEVEVALWLVRDELLGSAAARDQLVGAAAIARSIGHPHVRRLFDAGPLGATAYVTVQPASGGLRARLEAQAPALEPELLAYAQAICDGVTAGHQAGLVHGRLTPDCVVAVGGLLKVGGIGLWNVVDPHAARYAWRGQERYLAPEVLGGGPPAVGADVFSIAMLLGELVTGGSAADGAALTATLGEWQHPLAPVLGAALSAAPARRPPSVADLLAQIRRAYSGDEATTARRLAVQAPAAASAPASAAASGKPHAQIIDDAATVVDSGPPVAPPRPKRATQPWSGMGRGKVRGGHEPVGWTEVRLRASRETAREAEDGTTSERPAQAVRAPAPAPIEPSPPMLRAISMKPASHPGVKRQAPIAAIDRPEMQPVLRSIASTVAPAASQQQLGYYAPPKAAPQARPARKQTSWGFVALVGVVAAAGMALGVWFLLSRVMKQAPAPAPPPAPAPAAPQPHTPPVVVQPGVAPPGPCPDGMAPVPGEPAACIDLYESPGQGRMPQTGVSLAEAQTACRQRGARLCGDAEWERACRGNLGASYPYGETYRSEPCNTDIGKSAEIAVAGAFPDCKSATGAFDMSGNVAEWVAEGWSKGGSAIDHADGRCSVKVSRAEGRRYSEVGFRCCADPR